MGFLINQNVNLIDSKNIELDCGSIAYKGDINAHTWRVTVANNAGWLQKEGLSANVLFIFPSGTSYYSSATIDGDVITADFDANAYSEAGTVTAFMRIDSEEESLTIAVIRYTVSECWNDDVVFSSSDVVLPVKTLFEKYNELSELYRELVANGFNTGGSSDDSSDDSGTSGTTTVSSPVGMVTPHMYKKSGMTWDDAFAAMFADSSVCDYYVPMGFYNLTKPLVMNKIYETLTMSRRAYLNFKPTKNESYLFKVVSLYSKIEGGIIIHDESNRYNVNAVLLITSDKSANRRGYNVFLNEVTVHGNGVVQCDSTVNDTPTVKTQSTDNYAIYVDEAECRIYGAKVVGAKIGVCTNATDMYIENSYIELNTGNGLATTKTGGAIDAIHVHSFGNVGHGFSLNDGSNNLTNCYADTNKGDGFHIEKSSRPNSLVACRSFKNRGQYSFFLKDQANAVLISCRAENDKISDYSFRFSKSSGGYSNVKLICCYNSNSKGSSNSGCNVRGIMNAGNGISAYNSLS